MKSKITTTSLAFLGIIFIFFAVIDWPRYGSCMKDIIGALVFLTLAILNFKDRAVNLDATDVKNNNRNDEHADHYALVFLEWGSLALFVILILIYQLISSNLIIGITAIICLCYWSIANVVRIVIAIVLYKK
jgi:hypothetical protein